MRRIWLHIREETSTEERQRIRRAVKDLEAYGLIAFEGAPWEQTRSRAYEDRANEIALNTINSIRVQDFLRKNVGDTCWVENECTRE